MHSKLLLCPGLVCNSNSEENERKSKVVNKLPRAAFILKIWYNGVISVEKNYHS